MYKLVKNKTNKVVHGSWVQIESLVSNQGYTSATLTPNNEPWITGGKTDTQYQQTTEIYKANNIWEESDIKLKGNKHHNNIFYF